jgi:hypothetical protein
MLTHNGIFVNNLKRRGKNPPKATPKAEDMLGWLPWNLSKPKDAEAIENTAIAISSHF